MKLNKTYKRLLNVSLGGFIYQTVVVVDLRSMVFCGFGVA